MSYCRKHNLSPATEGMNNNQINIELSASHTYLALYSFFMNDKQSFHGFAKYFKYCSEEEMMHANKLIDYQNIRGGDVTIRNIPTPQFFILNNNRSTLYQAIDFVLNLEQNVYDSIINEGYEGSVELELFAKGGALDSRVPIVMIEKEIQQLQKHRTVWTELFRTPQCNY